MNLYASYKQRLPDPPEVVREFVNDVINDGLLDRYETWRMFADMGGAGVYADVQPSEAKVALDDYAARKGLTNVQKAEICVWLKGLFLDREVYDSIDQDAVKNGLSAQAPRNMRGNSSDGHDSRRRVSRQGAAVPLSLISQFLSPVSARLPVASLGQGRSDTPPRSRRQLRRPCTEGLMSC